MGKKVTFITGEFDSGKTTKLIDLYNHQTSQKADGFACIKRHDGPNGSFSGYDLRRLSTGVTFPFIILKDQYRNQFTTHFEHARFVFSRNTLHWGTQVLEDDLADEGIERLFIDEVGQLEIKGSGYDSILRMLFQCDKQLVLCVSMNNLIPIIRHYDIKEYDVIVADYREKPSGFHS